jgi:hypothetical protein
VVGVFFTAQLCAALRVSVHFFALRGSKNGLWMGNFIRRQAREHSEQADTEVVVMRVLVQKLVRA